MNPGEIEPDLQVAEITLSKAPESFAGRVSTGPAPLQQLGITRIRPSHVIVIGHEEMIQQKETVFFREPVRRFASHIQKLVRGAALCISLELDQEARHEVDDPAQ